MPTATGSNTVQLVINVVDANSGEVISRVTRNVDALGTAAQRSSGKVQQGWNDMGSGAVVAGRKGAAAMDEMGRHSLSALDNVRLLRDDFGIRIPRAMESVIAKSGALSGAIAAAGSGFVALGAAELIEHVGEQVYQLYERWLDTTKAVKDYEVEAGKAARQKLFDSPNFDTQMRLLQQAQGEVDRLTAKKKASESQSIILWGYDKLTGNGYTAKDSRQLADAMGRADQTDINTLEQSHRLMLQNIDDIEKRSKAYVTAAGAIEVERRAARQRNQENLSFAQIMDQKQVEAINRAHAADPKNNPFTARRNPDAGQTEYMAAEQSANASSSASSAALALQQQKDLMDLRHQATQTGLEGERLLQAQRVAAVEDLAQKWRFASDKNKQYMAEEAAINLRFDNEEKKRIEDQTEALRRKNTEAAARGLTGLAALDARTRQQTDDVQSDFDRHRFYGDRQQQADYASGLKRSIEAGSGAEAQKLQQDFTDHIQQMDDARANSSMTANARIVADTRRTVGELQKAFDTPYGGLNANDPRRVQGQQALDGEKGRIDQSAQDQIQRNKEDLARETRKLQMEAGRGGGGNRYAEQLQSIRADEEDRAAQVEQQRKQAAREGDLQAEEQYQDQLAAIHQIARNKELDLAREQRDKLAGVLRGFMSNPLEALKQQGEDIASKAAADMLMGHLPGRGAGNGSKAGGLFDGGVDSLFRPFQRGRGNAQQQPGAAVHQDVPSVAPQQAVVNATTATITVGNATFSGAVPGAPGGGKYVATGNGGYFNLGASPGNGEAGSGAAAAADSITGIGGGAGDGDGSVAGGMGSVGGSSAQMGYESPADAAQRIYGGSTGALQQANSIGKDFGIFGKNAAGNNAGLASKIPGLKNMSSESLGKLGGTAAGALGVFSAFEGKGGVMGGLQGALSGAQMGMEYGGPIGAAIGAAVGGVLGFMGHGARVQAQKYWFKELLPKAQQDMLGFESGSMDYQSAYDDFQAMTLEAKQRTKQMGPGAVGYYDDTIKPRIDQYMQRLTREQKAGRSQVGMSGAQFDVGGPINGFGSMGTYGDHGWIHAQRGEFVVQQGPAADHFGALQAIRSGATHQEMAAYYGGATTQLPVANDELHLHLHTLDTQTAEQWLVDKRHTLRSAVNQSYGENSGGDD